MLGNECYFLTEILPQPQEPFAIFLLCLLFTSPVIS